MILFLRGFLDALSKTSGSNVYKKKIDTLVLRYRVMQPVKRDSLVGKNSDI